MRISEHSLYIHFLRFFSALIVCLGHTKEFLFVPMADNANVFEKVTRLFFSLGSSAVLVFFFLSGYLVGGKVIRDMILRELNFSVYIFNRLTRLWVVLVPALIFTFSLNIITCGNSNNSLYCSANSELASRSALLPLNSQEVSDFFSNLFFLQPFKGVPWGGNGPLWSLSYEFWYYIVFFSSILILDSLFRKNISLAQIPHVLILFVASRILNADWFALGSIWVSGAGAAYLLSTNKILLFCSRFQKSFSLKFTWLTLFLIIPVLITLRVFSRWIAFPIIILALLFCLSIMQQNCQSTMNNKLQNLIVRGSEFSFSLYLIHFPLVALVSSQLTPINRLAMSPISIMLLLGITFGTIAISYGFAWLTEFNLKRFRNMLREYISPFELYPKK